MAADGGAEVGSEVVGGEEMVLGARAGEVDVDITRAASGGKEGGPGGVGSEETVLGAGAGAEWSGVPTGCIAGNWGRSAS